MKETPAPGTTASRNTTQRRYLADAGRFWAVFAACYGLLIFRGWDRVRHADLFAEGVRFVGQALNEGWATLFHPYDFYLHAAPKLVALLATTLVPVAYVPLATNLVCIALTAAAVATISRPGFRWLIPSDGARVALSLLLVLAPGLFETLGNLANLHWSLLLFLALLTLKDPKHPLTGWELALVALTVLSSAASVVFLPVALLRLALARGRHQVTLRRPALALGRSTGEAALSGILLLVTAYLFINFLTRDAQVGTGSLDIVAAARSLEDLLLSLSALFTTFYFVHPFLGTANTTEFLHALPSYYPLLTAALLVVAAMLLRLMRSMDYRFWLIPVWLASLFALAVMLSIVRYWSFYGLFSYPYEDWWFRYNFIYGATGLLFWFILLRVHDLTEIRRWPTAVMLVLIVGYFFQAQGTTVRARPPHHQDAFAITRYDETNYWAQTAGELARAMITSEPACVPVKGPPGGRWTFVYDNPRAPGDCPEE